MLAWQDFNKFYKTDQNLSTIQTDQIFSHFFLAHPIYAEIHTMFYYIDLRPFNVL